MAKRQTPVSKPQPRKRAKETPQALMLAGGSDGPPYDLTRFEETYARGIMAQSEELHKKQMQLQSDLQELARHAEERLGLEDGVIGRHDGLQMNLDRMQIVAAPVAPLPPVEEPSVEKNGKKEVSDDELKNALDEIGTE